MSQTITARGILFDMDGVLISSTGADEACWRRWARHHNMQDSFSPEMTHGRRALDTLQALRPDLDAAEEIRRLEAFDLDNHDGIVTLPGVRRLLQDLPAGSWTIVTSATAPLLANRVRAAGLPLPASFISADHVANGKPHAEPYTAGAALLGLAPRDCLVIEDSPAGVASGRAAGCRVLGVLTSHSAHQLADASWRTPSLEHVTIDVAEDGCLHLHLAV